MKNRNYNLVRDYNEKPKFLADQKTKLMDPAIWYQPYQVDQTKNEIQSKSKTTFIERG